MIPIAKNIIVVDEQGNEYEATYPKRAKGLVKNGRARFIAENKICLACPPNKILEDDIVNNHSNFDNTKIHERINQALQDDPQADIGEIIRQELAHDTAEKMKTKLQTPESEMPKPQIQAEGQPPQGKPPELSMEFVLSRIDKILNDTAYIYDSINTIKEMPTDTPWTFSEALSKIVESRESTNQKMLQLFEKMYNDLKSKNSFQDSPTGMEEFRKLVDSLQSFPPHILPPDMTKNILEEAARELFARPWQHE